MFYCRRTTAMCVIQYSQILMSCVNQTTANRFLHQQFDREAAGSIVWDAENQNKQKKKKGLSWGLFFIIPSDVTENQIKLFIICKKPGFRCRFGGSGRCHCWKTSPNDPNSGHSKTQQLKEGILTFIIWVKRWHYRVSWTQTDSVKFRGIKQSAEATSL